MRDHKVESKWECTKCEYTYESPVTGTRTVSHSPFTHQPAHPLKRVWQSKYDKIKT